MLLELKLFKRKPMRDVLIEFYPSTSLNEALRHNTDDGLSKCQKENELEFLFSLTFSHHILDREGE